MNSPRARFTLLPDIKERMKHLAECEGYSGSTHKKPVVAYGVGCDEGTREAVIFIRALLEKNPDSYGGRLASLVLDAMGEKGLSDSIEQGYRKGWVVGLCVSIENWAYETAKGVKP